MVTVLSARSRHMPRLCVARDADDWKQRPHVDDRREPGAKRARRQIGGEPRHGSDAEVGGDCVGARHDELETAAFAWLDTAGFAQLEAQASAVDSAVERVEQRPDRSVRRLELETQIGERGDGGGRILLAGGERRWLRRAWRNPDVSAYQAIL